eukprot:gene3534-13601_t
MAMDSARHGRLNPMVVAVRCSTWMRSTSNIFNHFNTKQSGSLLVTLEQNIVPRNKLPPEKSESSLVTLEQKIVPRYKLPPGVKGLARRIVAKQVQDMMKDLRAEVERRKKLELGGAESSGKTGSKCGKGAAACAAISLGRGGNLWLHTNPIHADSLIACLPVSIFVLAAFVLAVANPAAAAAANNNMNTSIPLVKGKRIIIQCFLVGNGVFVLAVSNLAVGAVSNLGRQRRLCLSS